MPPARSSVSTRHVKKNIFQIRLYGRGIQGVFYPREISNVGTNLGLLVHVLPGPNKRRVCKASMLLRLPAAAARAANRELQFNV
jgi:hypothetical protein